MLESWCTHFLYTSKYVVLMQTRIVDTILTSYLSQSIGYLLKELTRTTAKPYQRLVKSIQKYQIFPLVFLRLPGSCTPGCCVAIDFRSSVRPRNMHHTLLVDRFRLSVLFIYLTGVSWLPLRTRSYGRELREGWSTVSSHSFWAE